MLIDTAPVPAIPRRTRRLAQDCAALLRESALTAMRRDIDAAEVTAADVARAREAVKPSLDPVQVENLRQYAERRDA